MDRAKVQGRELEYLLEKGSSWAVGPLVCHTRGKQLLLAAGHHALTCSFSLEANVVGMKPGTFWKIVKDDVPGPSKTKGDFLRVFQLPHDLVEDGSSSSGPRTIKLVAAFVSESWVWAINDFSTLLTTHVTSHDIPWHLHDISPGSLVNFILFLLSIF